MSDTSQLPSAGPRILITGSPVSGKSALARALSERYGLQHFSAGEIVREMAETWPELKEALAKGQTIDSDRIDSKILTKLEEAGSWVIDGFPRFVPQLLKLIQMDRMPSAMIWFETTFPLAVKWASLRNRGDDSVENIKQRFTWFNSQTRHVLYYADIAKTIPVIQFFNMAEGNFDETLENLVGAIGQNVPGMSRLFVPAPGTVPFDPSRLRKPN